MGLCDCDSLRGSRLYYHDCNVNTINALPVGATEVTEVTMIEFADSKVPSVDQTTIRDTVRSFCPGLLDSGSMKFSTYYVGAHFRALYGYAMNMQNWYIVLPNGDLISFVGFITDFGQVKIDTDDEPDKLETYTVKISGLWYYFEAA